MLAQRSNEMKATSGRRSRSRTGRKSKIISAIARPSAVAVKKSVQVLADQPRQPAFIGALRLLHETSVDHFEEAIRLAHDVWVFWWRDGGHGRSPFIRPRHSRPGFYQIQFEQAARQDPVPGAQAGEWISFALFDTLEGNVNSTQTIRSSYAMPPNSRAVVLLSGGVDSATAAAVGAGGRLRALCPHHTLWPAARGRDRGRPPGRAGARRLTTRRARYRPACLRRERAHIEPRSSQGPSRGRAGERNTDHVCPRSQYRVSGARAAWAETLGAFDLFIGVNCVDYSGYPDCRPEFLRAFERLANVATRAGVEKEGSFRIHAPLLELNKEQIIERGRELGVDFGLTHSCYDPAPSGLACGRCDSCRIRRSAFQRLGLEDPVAYSSTA